MCPSPDTSVVHLTSLPKSTFLHRTEGIGYKTNKKWTWEVNVSRDKIQSLRYKMSTRHSGSKGTGDKRSTRVSYTPWLSSILPFWSLISGWEIKGRMVDTNRHRTRRWFPGSRTSLGNTKDHWYGTKRASQDPIQHDEWQSGSRRGREQFKELRTVRRRLSGKLTGKLIRWTIKYLYSLV